MLENKEAGKFWKFTRPRYQGNYGKRRSAYLGANRDTNECCCDRRDGTLSVPCLWVS